MKLTEFSVQHRITVLALIPLFIIVGLVSYLLLPREAQPDIAIPLVIVSTPYIGVAPEDIETLVTQPLERELKDVKGVEEFKSTSAEGVTIVQMKFLPQYKIDDVLPKIRDKVDRAKKDLPKDVEETQITEVSFSDFPKILVVISGDFGLPKQATLEQLKKMGDILKKELEGIEGVLEVKESGGIEREIRVEVYPHWLDHYNVSFDDVVKAVRDENINMPSGTLEVGKLNFLLRVPADFKLPAQIENVVVKTKKGQPILVRQVARVVDTHKDLTTKARLNGKPSFTLSITTRSGANLIKTVDTVKTTAAKVVSEFHPNTRLDFLADVSVMIRRTVNELENNIISGLILVLLVLFLFLGVRNAVFVAMAIPMSMLISFMIISVLGMTLNMVVLFALILALGMLVDNAIVIVENIYRHATDLGKDKVAASLDGTTEVAWPVITSTLTTLCAFGPLLFWPGIMGEFMKYMPMTLIITLTASLFVALVINPVLCAQFLGVGGPPSEQPTKPGLYQRMKSWIRLRIFKRIDPKGDAPKAPQSLQDSWFLQFYRAVLRFSLRWRWLMILLTLVMFFGTMVAYGKLNHGVEFFPVTTPDRVFIGIDAPDGKTLDFSDAIVKRIEAVVLKLKNVKKVTAEVGGGSSQQTLDSSNSNSPHKSRITVEFLDQADRIESTWETVDKIRKGIAHLAGATIRVERERMGPPAGAPVAIEISGVDLELLKKLNDSVVAAIKNTKGLVDLRTDLSTAKPELRIKPNRRLLAQLSLFSTSNLGRTIRAAIHGEKASNFRTFDDQHDITVRLAEEYREHIEQIRNLRIKGDKGKNAPVGLIAEIDTGNGYGSIRHKDRKRVITIRGDVEGRNVVAVQKEVAKILAKMKWPKGYTWKLAGENVEQEKAQKFLGKALGIAVFLIFLVILTQFNSLAQSSIILFSVVLSIVGVLWGLVISGTPFGVLMTGLGVISLAGVVVNNAIVLIDYTNQLVNEGKEVFDAVIEAAATRLRPVLLTAVTTVLGLIPMAMGWSVDFMTFPDIQFQVGGTSAEWWGPMAVAVAYGLVVATGLTLGVVPVLYYTIWRVNSRIAAFLGRHRLIRAFVYAVGVVLVFGFIVVSVRAGLKFGGAA
ncbi:MAG: efflux RND transporter permease subunit [Myxococcales bacterium]|nr:efflux RND transporter permease subunit [Myxococcales bacterium]